MNEFDLIRQYFETPSVNRADVPLGIGDDCALVQPKPGFQLAITTDTMVDGIHFDSRLSPADIGHKLLAVNLSDLAAMGAEPCWISLATTLPEVNEHWLAGFSEGLFALAREFDVSLIGGDVTRGALTLSITAQGQVAAGKALTRSGANVGDLIYVSGHLGDAALALNHSQITQLPKDQQQQLEQRLFRPSPRVSLGQALVGYATACIDLSDGLSVDLGHLLKRSGKGASLMLDQVPTSSIARNLLGHEQAAKLAFSGGDDYELCFTVPAHHQEAIETISTDAETPVTLIGQVTSDSGLKLRFNDVPVNWKSQGFMHFYDQDQ
ncbi:thiamine-phosphate kinase [Echinimonas agarilytica]|uniref:Thiamine-monophosphate kinase n=1 Tax=Echinimonas agarilytica TaxID=1215918 RepID=A0AA41W8Z7_9GAMM|nr:thiamine-phosphate kinase [Echinimonas agarilytica]